MKKIVAVVTGGFSREQNIALKSADVVLKHLDKSLYEAYKVIITKNSWYVELLNENKNVPINKSDFTFENNGIVAFDVVFNIIHGPPGEDGTLQAYFDLLEIPYTGSNQLASNLTFDKHRTKLFLQNVHDLYFAKSIFLNCDNKDDFEATYIADQLGFPLFIKPNRAGSSYGITKAKNHKEIERGIEEAFRHDDEVLIEAAIDGREITCGVLRNDCDYEAFPITEIVTNNEFFDYDAKYTAGVTDEITPAQIDKTLALKCQKVSLAICKLLHTKGVVRVDYIMSDEKMFLIEVNAIPGLSEESIIPKQAKAKGMELKALFTHLITEALGKK